METEKELNGLYFNEWGPADMDEEDEKAELIERTTF